MRNVRVKRCSHGVPVIRCNPDCFALFGKNSPSFGRRAPEGAEMEFAGRFFLKNRGGSNGREGRENCFEVSLGGVRSYLRGFAEDEEGRRGEIEEIEN